MSKTNCINCGATKELSDAVCPFCGTKYADFTTFDIMSRIRYTSRFVTVKVSL